MFAEKVNLPSHCGNCINYAWDDNNNTCLAGVVCEYDTVCSEHESQLINLGDYEDDE